MWIWQHASDEKYNFERLSKTTVLNRQPLLRLAFFHSYVFIIVIFLDSGRPSSEKHLLTLKQCFRPLPLDLSASEELIVLTHLEAFRWGLISGCPAHVQALSLNCLKPVTLNDWRYIYHVLLNFLMVSYSRTRINGVAFFEFLKSMNHGDAEKYAIRLD